MLNGQYGKGMVINNWKVIGGPGMGGPGGSGDFGPPKYAHQTGNVNRAFSLTWPASMQIYWNKRKRLHKKGVQLPQDWFGTPTWPPFHCFADTNMAAVTSCENILALKLRVARLLARK